MPALVDALVSGEIAIMVTRGGEIAALQPSVPTSITGSSQP
jgi:hypothetical protein